VSSFAVSNDVAYPINVLSTGPIPSVRSYRSS
jgi:hypothetical protein